MLSLAFVVVTFPFAAVSASSDFCVSCLSEDDMLPSDQITLVQTNGVLKQAHQRTVSAVTAECPVEVQSLFAGSRPHKSRGFTRVLMADYPSTGSSWLKQLLTVVATSEGYGSPACAIYPEGDRKLPGDVSEVFCECADSDVKPDAALIKTHYPAQELYNGESLASGQYNASMGNDRILQLVRHPIASISSNVDRWGGNLQRQSGNLQCWGAWGERVKGAMDNKKNVLVLRYEDLCSNTAAKVHEVLQYLGGSFKSISLTSVEASLAACPDLACIHKHDLERQTQVTSENEFILDDLQDLMTSWGYSTAKTSEWSQFIKAEAKVQTTAKRKDICHSQPMVDNLASEMSYIKFLSGQQPFSRGS